MLGLGLGLHNRRSRSWTQQELPTGLTLSLITGGVKIDWTDNTAGLATTEIWGQSDGAAYALLYTIAAGTTTKSETVDAFVTRYIKIRQLKDGLYSPFTAPVNILTELDLLLTKTGDGNTVAYVEFIVSSNMTVTLSGNAKFYSDAGGTADESSSWTITTGAARRRYIRLALGTALLHIPFDRITEWTNNRAAVGAPFLTIVPKQFKNLTNLSGDGRLMLIGGLPDTLVTLNNIAAYEYLNWAYTGVIPSSIRVFRIFSAAVSVVITNDFDSNVTAIELRGSITWISSAPFNKLTILNLNSATINYTNLDFSGTSNISVFTLAKWRTSKISSADMITLLTSLTNRIGTLPATITINDYVDYASPPQAVTDAVATLKTTKSITTVNLGA